MRAFIAVVLLAGSLATVACGSPTAPSAAPATTGGSTASCNGKPPGQQPSGNPAQAPGNSSSLDKDCKSSPQTETVVWGT